MPDPDSRPAHVLDELADLREENERLRVKLITARTDERERCAQWHEGMANTTDAAAALVLGPPPPYGSIPETVLILARLADRHRVYARALRELEVDDTRAADEGEEEGDG